MTNAVLRPRYNKGNHRTEPFFMSPFFNPGFREQTVFNKTTDKVLSNIIRNENNHVIEMAIPGFTKENILISVDGNILKVKGNKEISETQFIKREFRLDNFERTFSLPKTVDFDKIEASVKDGILHILIYNLVEKPALQIHVK